VNTKCPNCGGKLVPSHRGEAAQLELCTCPTCDGRPGPLWLELLNVLPQNFRLAQAQACYPDVFEATGLIVIWKPSAARWGDITAQDFHELAIAGLRVRNRIRDALIDLIENNALEELPMTINAIAQIELSGGKVDLRPGRHQQNPNPRQPETHTYAKRV
jgi:hypothetical protein